MMGGAGKTMGLGLMLRLTGSGEFATETRRVEGSMSSLDRTADARAASISRSMAQMKAGLKMIGVGAAMLAMVAAPTKAAATWETSMARISLLVDTARYDMTQISRDVLQIGTQYGQASAQAAQAAETILRSGTPVERLSESLALAGEAAVGGMTDINTAASIGMTILDIYGEKAVGGLEGAYDSLFASANRAGASFAELATPLQRIMPYAQAAGITFESLVATMGTITQRGQNASEALTSLRSMIMGLGSPSEGVGKMLMDLGGAEFEAAAQAGNLVRMMEILAPKLTETGDMVDIASRRGVASLSILANSLGELRGHYDAQIDKAGQMTRAYEVMGEQVEHLWQTGLKQLGRVWITMGQPMLAITARLLKYVGALLERVADWAVENQGLAKVVGYLVGGLGILLIAVGAINVVFAAFNILVIKSAVALAAKAFAIKYYTVTTWGAVAATWALMVPWLAVIGIAVAVGLAVYAVIKNWGAITSFFSRLWEGVKETFAGFYDWVSNRIPELLLVFFPILGIPLMIRRHWEPIKAYFVGLVEAIKKPFADTIDFFSRTWNTILGGINRFVDTVRSIFARVRDIVLAPFRAVWSVIDSLASLLPSFLRPEIFERGKEALATAGAVGMTAVVPMAQPPVTAYQLTPPPAITARPVEETAPAPAMHTTAQIVEREVIRESVARQRDTLTRDDVQTMVRKMDEFSRKPIEMSAGIYLDSDTLAETVSRRTSMRKSERGYR